MSPGGASNPEPPRSPSQSTEIHADGAVRTIRQRPTKLCRTSAAGIGSKASAAETYDATCQQDDVSHVEQNSRRELTLENLPEDILHCIHSLLPVEDAARAACVSRLFLSSWRCRSNLIINNHTLGFSGEKFEELEINLNDRVDQIIENHCANGVKVGKDSIRLDPVVGYDEKDLRRKPECRHNKLTQVKIMGFHSAKNLVELTVHILESAPSLESLTLDMAHGYDAMSTCHDLREIGQCSLMTKTALTKAQKATEVAVTYIAGRVPMGVEFQVVKSCN